MEFITANLIPLLSALGAGAVLGKLLDFIFNRRHKKVELDSLIIQEISKELERQRKLIEVLQEEVVQLRSEVKNLTDEADHHRSVIRRRDDFYFLAVRLVEEEPPETLRAKLQQLLEDMKSLVMRGK